METRIITKARKFARKVHKNQLDDTGKPYFVHLQQTANILKQVTDDDDIIAAGYLHDTIEDQNITPEVLSLYFNDRIASLVYEVTHEGNSETGYYFPRLKSRDAILIKFADRLSNLSRMESWSDRRKNHYIKKSTFWKLTT